MSIHEIRLNSGHGYIHLPGCNKSPAWRIRRFLRQLRAEINVLVKPTKCVCASQVSGVRDQVSGARDEGLFDGRGFPTQKWFDQIKVD